MLTWIAFAVGALTGALVFHFARRARLSAGMPIPTDALVALVLDSVDAAITVYDGRGQLIRANRCAEQLSGYTEAELKDPETWRSIIPPEDYSGVAGFLDHPKLSDFPRPNVNGWITRSGERRLMKWSNVALDDGHGGVLLVVCIGFDITAQRQFEGELIEARNRAQEANAAKSLFLANMSHELRTPLNAIIGFSQIIRDGLVGVSPEKSAEYAGDIHDSAVLLLDLISDILDMSKLEANKAVVEAREVDVTPMIASCIRLVRQRAQEVGIKIVQRIDTDLPLLHADERMVKQVLLNLLSNAIKFAPRAGAVLVTARAGAQGGMEISVADSGIGIPQGELANLFRPFFQVQSPRVQKAQGTGLGLAISKRLIELHDGRIGIASVEGKGTTVTVALPASRCTAQPAERAARPLARTGTGN
jgi:two-component system cell cycle sensor histidine kinase PleC